MSFIDKIDEFCAEHRISASRFEREAGLAKGIIPKWRNKGFLPTYKSQKKLSAYMNISIENLMSEDPSDFITDSGIPDSWQSVPDVVRDASLRYIPVFRYLEADEPDPDASDIIRHIPVLPENLESPSDCFGITVNDSGMEPYIEAGDLVIVRRDSDPQPGEIVVASIPGDKTVCRKLMKDKGCIILQPFNRHFTPDFYREEEIDFLPVNFIGKVVTIIRCVNIPSEGTI